MQVKGDILAKNDFKVPPSSSTGQGNARAKYINLSFLQILKVENYMSSSACSTIFITIVLACHVVCQNMNRLSSVQIILIMSQIYIKEKLFSDNYLYHFIA